MDPSSHFQSSTPEEVKAVMLAELQQILGSVDEEFISELAELFLEEYPPQLAAAAEALASAELNRLKNIAHSLKGSSSNMGLRRLSQLCHVLETKARDNEWKGAQVQFAYIKAEYQAVAQTLAEYL